MKKLLTLLATTFFLFSAYTFARSEECLNPFPEFVQIITSHGPDDTVKPITDAEKASLYAKKGPPPVDEPFNLAVARAGSSNNGMIIIVKDGCIVGKIGPLPLFVIENLLGNSGA